MISTHHPPPITPHPSPILAPGRGDRCITLDLQSQILQSQIPSWGPRLTGVVRSASTLSNYPHAIKERRGARL